MLCSYSYISFAVIKIGEVSIFQRRSTLPTLPPLAGLSGADLYQLPCQPVHSQWWKPAWGGSAQYLLEELEWTTGVGVSLQGILVLFFSTMYIFEYIPFISSSSIRAFVALASSHLVAAFIVVPT